MAPRLWARVQDAECYRDQAVEFEVGEGSPE